MEMNIIFFIRRLTFTFLLLTELCVSGFGQLEEDNLEQARIVRNKIKSVTCTTTLYVIETRKKVDHISSYKEYNRNGLLIKRMEYNSDKKMENKMNCTTDEKGNYTGCYEETFYSNGVVDDSIRTLYDSLGHPIERITYSGGKLIEKTRFVYNNKGQRIKEEFSSKDTIMSYFTYLYNDENHLIECLVTEYGYTNNDDFNYYPTSKFIYKYDINGNEIEYKTYLNGKLKYKSIQVYDSLNNKLEARIYNEKDSLWWKWDYVYDKNNNQILKKAIYYPELNTWVEKYKYDKNGNFIKETKFKDEVIISINRFKYEFYK